MDALDLSLHHARSLIEAEHAEEQTPPGDGATFDSLLPADAEVRDEVGEVTAEEPGPPLPRPLPPLGSARSRIDVCCASDSGGTSSSEGFGVVRMRSVGQGGSGWSQRCAFCPLFDHSSKLNMQLLD